MIKNIAVSALTSLTVLALGVTYLSVNANQSETITPGDDVSTAYAVSHPEPVTAVSHELLASLIADVGISFHPLEFYAPEAGVLRLHFREVLQGDPNDVTDLTYYDDIPIVPGTNELLFTFREVPDAGVLVLHVDHERGGKGRDFSLTTHGSHTISMRHPEAFPPGERVRLLMRAHDQRVSSYETGMGDVDQVYVDAYTDVLFIDVEYIPDAEQGFPS